MSFIRPEVAAGIARWGEALAGLAALGAGIWLTATAYGVLFLFGVAFCILGGGLILTGIRRARRPEDGGGAGVVEVDERQITYLSGTGGGIISVDQLVEVRVRRGVPGNGKGFLWLFRDEAGQTLAVPSNAEGASALFDVLYALPGFRIDDAFDLGALADRGPFLAWERPRARLH